MIRSLSILLPTYNCFCGRLVKTLQEQCLGIVAEGGAFSYEIVVADDCSTDRSYVAANSTIERLDGVRYIRLDSNIGRSAIRNFLARESRSEWLLFIDGDLQVEDSCFIRKYASVDCSADTVVVGGIAIGGDAAQWHHNLRWLYEKRCEPAHTARQRQALASREFRTTNFLVPRDAVLRHPFDEHFLHYGYEDVLFGKGLCSGGYSILHIDNPVVLDDFEPNGIFVAKTEEACRTLMEFSSQLRSYSTLLDTVLKIRRLHANGIFTFIYWLLGKSIRRNLCSRKPSVRLFNVYKLLYCNAILQNRSSAIQK